MAYQKIDNNSHSQNGDDNLSLQKSSSDETTDTGVYQNEDTCIDDFGLTFDEDVVVFGPFMEYLKFVLSCFYCAIIMIGHAFSMVYVTNRVYYIRNETQLTDVILDNVRQFPWALQACEYCMVVLFCIWLLIVIFHRHRIILLRRQYYIQGNMYFMRIITTIVTGIPLINDHKRFALTPRTTFKSYVERVYQIMATGSMQITVMHEVCQWETFNASCSNGELLIMESARYGRMNLGRCLTTDYFVGCSADVLNHVDTICSGRSRCSIDIPDPKLFNVQPCRKDLVAHFTASYSCKKVVNSDARICKDKFFSDLPPKGLLATHITGSARVGSKACPWKIQVSPGQHINVSVYDFSTWGRGVTDSTELTSNGCHIIGVIKEEQHHVEIRACAGGARHYPVYLSTTSTIEIEIFQPISMSYAGYAIIEYEAVGCSDMEPTDTYETHRKGDIIMVNCIDTTQTWHLVCTDNGWIGQIGNCTFENSKYAPADKQSYVGDDIPFGLLIAISIGAILGMVLGLLFLMIVLLCKKKAKTSAIANPPERCAAYIGGEAEYSKHADVSYKLIDIRKSQASLCKHELSAKEATPHSDNTMTISHVDGLWYKKDVLLQDQQSSLLCTNCTGGCHPTYNDKETFHFDLIHDENRRFQPLSTFMYPTVHQDSDTITQNDATLS